MNANNRDGNRNQKIINEVSSTRISKKATKRMKISNEQVTKGNFNLHFWPLDGSYMRESTIVENNEERHKQQNGHKNPLYFNENTHILLALSIFMMVNSMFSTSFPSLPPPPPPPFPLSRYSRIYHPLKQYIFASNFSNDIVLVLQVLQKIWVS